MKIYAYFSKENLPNLMQALQRLSSCDMISISASEKPRESDVKLWEEDKSIDFLNSNPEGFFLHCNAGLFDVSLYDNMYSTICFFSNGFIGEDGIFDIMKAYAAGKAEFGYAATEEEFEYRNRIKAEVPSGEIEAWVGRNLSKYLPGLYYITLISRTQIEKKHIDVESLKSSSIHYIEPDDNIIIFKFFGNSEMWDSEKNKIDQLCATNKNIFCKFEIENEVRNSKNVMDFIIKTREWN